MADGAAKYVEWYGKKRTQNWRTPRYLFDPLDREFGFTLDGAAEKGNELLPRASTAANQLSWIGERVFCNPPWSNIGTFIELAPSAELAVFLVPARTNVAWFHRALELGAKPRFFRKRPVFVGAPHNCPVDCLLLIFKQRKVRHG